MQLIWQVIENVPKYQVSNTGQVRHVVNKRCRKQQCMSGYMNIMLPTTAGVRKRFKVHRLVAAAFIGDINGVQVNHRDSNRANNYVNNLEIVTHKENLALRRGSNTDLILIRNIIHWHKNGLTPEQIRERLY